MPAKQSQSDWQCKAPIIIMLIYAFLATVLAVYIALNSANPKSWAYKSFRFICPPASYASVQTNLLFSDAIDRRLFTKADFDNHTDAQLKMRYDAIYTIPTIIYGVLFYWLGTWLLVKLYTKLKSRNRTRA